MIDDILNDTQGRHDYLSYLLRLWRVGKEEAAWRASLESPHTGERIGFASLDALFAFLRQQIDDEAGEKGPVSPLNGGEQ
jgi:hypothetical protein